MLNTNTKWEEEMDKRISRFQCIALTLFFMLFCSAGAMAQQTVSGTVTDAQTGNTLPGVNILVEGTSTGTATDSKGRYSLDVSSLQDTLRFSFIGYNTKNVPIDGRTTINIKLTSAIYSGNQLVVIGYGKQKRKDITSSISSISSEELNRNQPINIGDAIEGKVPGVYVAQTSGEPGSTPSVRIRGIGSTGNNQPLYVVDGIPIGGDLSTIDPQDIESIQILKDAASTAIYGARGANGVVLITTKKGSEGNLKVNLNASGGFSQVWRKPEFLNAEEFATLANEISQHGGIPLNPQWSNPKQLGNGTNMVNHIFRNAPRQNYHLSVSGGNKHLNTRLSLGYNNQEGTIVETKFKRYTGRLTTNLKTNFNLKVGGSLAFDVNNSKVQNTNAMQGGILNLAGQFIPTLGPDEPFFGDGLYYTKDGDNPLLRAKTIDNEPKNSKIYANIHGEYEIIPQLNYKIQIGIIRNFFERSIWQPVIHRGFYNHVRATLNVNNKHRNKWVIVNTLSYSKQIGSSNTIKFTIGQSAQKRKTNSLTAIGRGFLNETERVINGSDVTQRSTSGTASESDLASYFGRIRYSFKDKYLISGSFRRDGSSNFGSNNKWGYFPSVSAGWRLSKESFLNSSKIVSNLKIRGSWGESGSDAIPAFGYLGIVQTGSNAANYVLGHDQDIVTGSIPSRPANPSLRWETIKQYNGGFNAGLFNNKLNITADYYVKNTSDMLIGLPVSLESGFNSSPSINGGEVQNRGFELSIGYNGTWGGFHYNISGNMSTLHNEVKSLGVGQPIVGNDLPGSLGHATYTKVGMPIGYFRGYIVDGIYQTDEAVNTNLQPDAKAGDFIFRDVNGDGELSDADKVYLGKPWPDVIYGLSLGGSFKGFSFSVFLQGINGSQIFDLNKESTYPIKYFNGNGFVNARKAVLGRWTPSSGVNDIPALRYIDANGNYSKASSFYVEDGDYMRIRNVKLSYTFSQNLISKLGPSFRSIKFYVNVANLYTLTNYTGYDPEVSSKDPLNARVDPGTYPVPRTFLFGMNFGF